MKCFQVIHRAIPDRRQCSDIERRVLWAVWHTKPAAKVDQARYIGQVHALYRFDRGGNASLDSSRLQYLAAEEQVKSPELDVL